MDNVVYRKMTKEDAFKVAAVEAVSFADPWSEGAFFSAASDDNYVFIVAEYAGNIIGMAGIIISFDEATVTNVAVLPEFRGKGIAGSIMKTLLAEGEAQGILAFTLEVRESNVPARKLYEGFGFENVGKRPGFYEHPKEDAVVYWKRN